MPYSHAITLLVFTHLHKHTLPMRVRLEGRVSFATKSLPTFWLVEFWQVGAVSLQTPRIRSNGLRP